MRARVALLTGLAALLAPAGALAAHSDLAGRWQFDGADAGGTLTPDSSGHGNDAQIEVGTPFSSDGRFGGSLDQRTNLYDVNVPAAAELEPGTLTVISWVKASETPGAYRYLVAKGGQGACDLDPADDNASFALRTGSDERIHFFAWNGVTLTGSESPSADVFDGQWHAVAGVYDGAKVRLYVDGAQVGGEVTATGGIAYGLPERRLMFGRNHCDAHFPALIDDVRIYDRVLTPTEIATLAAGGELPGDGPGPGPAPGSPPRSLERPRILADDAAPGSYRCDPGTWEGLAAGSEFRFTWRDVRRGEAASTGPTFTPQPSDYGFTYYCAVSASNSFGEGTAVSDTVFFTSAGIDTLPPPYGNLRIRGIDVFQTVQPESGAAMFGFPDGAFPSIPGAGTPTSYRFSGAGGTITSVRPQEAGYLGVTLDSLKPTTASVYVGVAGSEPADPRQTVEVTLVARRNGRQMGAPLVRTMSGLRRTDSPVVTAAERQRPGFSARFRLPSLWVSGGDFELEARVAMPPGQLGATYGLRECDADCSRDNSFSLTGIDTDDTPQVVINSVQLTRTGQTSLTAPASILSAAQQLFPGGPRLKILPYQATLDISTEAGLNATQIPGSSPPSFRCNGQTYAPPTFTTAAVATRTCRWLAIDARLLAWTAQNPARELEVTAPSLGGPGNVRLTERYDLLLAAHDYNLPSGNPEPGWQVNGDISGVSPITPTNTAPYFTVNSRVRPLTAAAHELGHALTAPHADQTCGGGGEGWAPDNRGRLAGTKYVQGNAFRSGFAEVDDPVLQLFDLMSYCADNADTSYRDGGNAWLSPRNWTRLFSTLRAFGSREGYGDRPRAILGSATARAAQAPRPGGPVAVGSVGPAGGLITRLLPADRERSAIVSVDGSNVRLRSLDGSGQILLDAGVEVRPGSESAPGSGGVFAGPVADGAAAVELVRDGAVLHTLRRGAAPRVRLDAPRRGARVARTLSVRWRASDPDSEALMASVQFSADGGRNWRTVYDGPSTGAARVPGRFLQGTRNARVRVGVSDGFSETRATSGRFRVAGTRPVVRIISPASGDPLVAGERVLLVGTAFDDRGTSLRGRALRWFAGRRALGRGARRAVLLRPGRTDLRLVARDRLGRRSTARLRVRVEPKRLRILRLRFPQVVRAGARRVSGTIRVSGAATLRSRRTTYRLGSRPRRITLALPRSPRAGLVRARFTLNPRGRDTAGRIRGTVEVVRP